MNAIAAADEKWGIGKDGGLLIHLPGDLKYFKEKTLGGTIIIGRGTFDSMSGRLLTGRETVILSKNRDFKPGCRVLYSVEEILEYVKGKPEDEVFVAGGEEVYRLLFPYCNKIFITKIYATFESDRYFPEIDEIERSFFVGGMSEMMEENGVRYQWIDYYRKEPGYRGA